MHCNQYESSASEIQNLQDFKSALKSRIKTILAARHVWLLYSKYSYLYHKHIDFHIF